MSTEMWIYLWWLADNIREPAVTIGFIGFIGSCIMVTVCLARKTELMANKRRFDRAEWPEDKAEEKRKYEDELDESDQEYKSLCLYRNMVITVSLCGIIPALFLPDSKAIAAIAVVPRIIESDVVQKDTPQLYRAGVDYMINRLNERGDKVEFKERP